MRTKPILGKKVWFEPRRWGGWGWTPASWEGWVVIASVLAAIVVISAVMKDGRSVAPTFVLVGVLLVVCWLKGTSPGGPAARKRFRAERERDAERGTRR
jgi:hypothetical protein